MPIRKLKHVETPDDRMRADAVARVRRASPPRDTDGEHHATCAELARASGLEPQIVIDAWDEATSIHLYAGHSQLDAERLAIVDVRDRYRGSKP